MGRCSDGAVFFRGICFSTKPLAPMEPMNLGEIFDIQFVGN